MIGCITRTIEGHFDQLFPNLIKIIVSTQASNFFLHKWKKNKNFDNIFKPKCELKCENEFQIR
jgi:hypothetical protein